MNDLNPVQYVDGIYLKRNDLYTIGGCNGGKAESADKLIRDGIAKGYDTFVTSGSRYSPQCLIISNLCEYYKVKCHVFMPLGDDTKVITALKNNANTTLHQPYRQGSFQNVLNSLADKYAKEVGGCLIPFGMRDRRNIEAIAKQCENIPDVCKRLVVPVGSGMTLCGILHGLAQIERTDIKVVGVITGGKPQETLDKFAPKPLLIGKPVPKYELIWYGGENIIPRNRYFMRTDYKIGDVQLDPIYEGKCFEVLLPNDLFWIVGYHEI